MKLASLTFVLVASAAACGGKSKAPTGDGTGNTGGAKTGVPAEWSAVFVKGASFTLNNDSPEVPNEDPYFVYVTVDEVTTEGDHTRASLRWHDGNGEDVMTSGLPLMVQVGPAGVWFWEGGQEIEPVFAGPPTYPAGSDKTLRDGYYDVVTRNADGTVCYGWEPGPDAGDCEDVCFADLCVSAAGGVVSGSGTWWPNSEMYQQVKK